MKKDDLITLIIFLGLSLILSWAICIGLFWLITLCLPINFSLKTATGIWLVLFLIKWAFDIGRKNNG